MNPKRFSSTVLFYLIDAARRRHCPRGRFRCGPIRHSGKPPPAAMQRAIYTPPLPIPDFINRAMQFVLKDQVTWYKGKPVTDEEGKPLPAYFRYAKLRPSGMPYSGSEFGRDSVYPAFHHALAIQSYLSYYVYSGDRNSLEKAMEVADWNIKNSTPKNLRYGGLPYSTFLNGVPGGFMDGDAIMTDKPAIMALAYLKLYRMTGEDRYRAAGGPNSRNPGPKPTPRRELALSRQSQNGRSARGLYEQRHLCRHAFRRTRQNHRQTPLCKKQTPGVELDFEQPRPDNALDGLLRRCRGGPRKSDQLRLHRYRPPIF